MGCTEHSSSCSMEIDDPLYLRRLSQGISQGSLREWSHLFCIMWIVGWLWSQCKGNWPHLNLILGTPRNFAFLGWHQCSSRLVTVLLGPLEFNQANRGSVRVWLGKRNCSGHNARESGLISQTGEVSWVFWSCSRNLAYILELRWGCPFETGVCSVNSGHLSRYEGQLRNVKWAWQENKDASGS